jgi:hypothetical protein
MTRRIFCLLAVVLATSACGRTVTGPDPVAVAPSVQPVSVSGRVYMTVNWGDPPIEEVLIDVKHANGAGHTTRTNDEGYYQFFVEPGNVTLVVTRDGFQGKQVQFDVKADTVLNFGLIPAE